MLLPPGRAAGPAVARDDPQLAQGSVKRFYPPPPSLTVYPLQDELRPSEGSRAGPPTASGYLDFHRAALRKLLRATVMQSSAGSPSSTAARRNPSPSTPLSSPQRVSVTVAKVFVGRRSGIAVPGAADTTAAAGPVAASSSNRNSPSNSSENNSDIVIPSINYNNSSSNSDSINDSDNDRNGNNETSNNPGSSNGTQRLLIDVEACPTTDSAPLGSAGHWRQMLSTLLGQGQAAIGGAAVLTPEQSLQLGEVRACWGVACCRRLAC